MSTQEHRFDYNSTRAQLLMSEYGRNVQNMINHLKTLTDKQERNLHARAVIDLMGQLNPHLRDVTDFKHKLWDHLFVIAGFDLDVDSPFPPPTPESVFGKPQPITYPGNHIKYRHYGKTVQRLIEKAKTLPDSPRKMEYISSLASFMKMSYIAWNKEGVSDETILHDLSELSNHEIDVKAPGIHFGRIDHHAVAKQTSNRDTREAREKLAATRPSNRIIGNTGMARPAVPKRK